MSKPNIEFTKGEGKKKKGYRLEPYDGGGLWIGRIGFGEGEGMQVKEYDNFAVFLFDLVDKYYDEHF